MYFPARDEAAAGEILGLLHSCWLRVIQRGERGNKNFPVNYAKHARYRQYCLGDKQSCNDIFVSLSPSEISWCSLLTILLFIWSPCISPQIRSGSKTNRVALRKSGIVQALNGCLGMFLSGEQDNTYQTLLAATWMTKI